MQVNNHFRLIRVHVFKYISSIQILNLTSNVCCYQIIMLLAKIEDRDIIDNNKTETTALKYNFKTSLIERCM